MKPRHPHEPHRVATPLELFFDLVFVVAIAQASAGLHHAIASGHAGEGVLWYGMVFFGIWWAWMNFTWFASAYDPDDVPYRLTVFVQMTGALIFTAGIESMFSQGRLTLAVTGYVVMRLAMITQWLRAARNHPERRHTALRYVIGIGLAQLCWVGVVFLPQELVVGTFFALCAVELLIPAWAERGGSTPWHRHHIAERYGLMTIIVLGESVLAATTATQRALSSGVVFSGLVPIVVGGLLTVYVMWWLYFDHPAHDLLASKGDAFLWGYGHYLIFAAAAGVGAGIAVAVDQRSGVAPLEARAAGWAFVIPVALYLGMLGLLHARRRESTLPLAVSGSIAMVLLTPFTGAPVLWTGVALAGLLVLKLAARRRRVAPLSA